MNLFHPDLLANKEATKQGLQRPFMVIENALRPAFAERLRTELLDSPKWGRQSINDPGFVYQREYILMDAADAPAALAELYAYLGGSECLKWISEVSGRRCDGFQGAAAIFKPGDQISVHNDKFILTRSDGSKAIRAVTFNYYLTKDWDARWGGRLMWKNPYTEIVPDFNTLVMFNVGQDTHHWVEPINAGVTTKRLSITGWFLSSVSNSATDRKKLNIKI